MTYNHPRPDPRSFMLRAGKLLTVAMVMMFVAALYVPTLSAQIVAPAGSVIGNQATATYNDASGVSRQAFSNLVQTTVTQIFKGTLTSSQTKYATAGTQVLFPHTYTNTGNGPDSVTFTAPASSGNLSSIAVYMDANGDGIPDNTTNLSGTAIPIAANGVVKVVAVATLTAGSSSGGNFNLTAASAGGGTVTGSPNTDTVTLSTNGVINVTKSMTISGGVITVNLNYTNTGNNTATAVTILDPLKAQGYFTYVQNSATFNGTAFTDAAPPAAFTSWTGYTVATNAPQAVIASVAPGVSGSITYTVTAATPSTYPATFTNYAEFQYADGGGNTIPGAGSYINTNTVNYLISGYDFAQFTAGTPGTLRPAL